MSAQCHWSLSNMPNLSKDCLKYKVPSRKVLNEAPGLQLTVLREHEKEKDAMLSALIGSDMTISQKQYLV